MTVKCNGKTFNNSSEIKLDKRPASRKNISLFIYFEDRDKYSQLMGKKKIIYTIQNNVHLE